MAAQKKKRGRNKGEGAEGSVAAAPRIPRASIIYLKVDKAQECIFLGGSLWSGGGTALKAPVIGITPLRRVGLNAP